MRYRLLADAVLLLHFAFILFAVFGALLAARRRALLPWHLGAAAWACGIEASGAVCPLTWAENRLRGLAGDAGYGGGFIEHYLVAAIYPPGLDRGMQDALAIGVLAVNVVLYAWLLRRRKHAGPG